MFRLSEKIKKAEDKINAFISENKSRLLTYIGIGLLILYFYGMLVRFIGVGALNFRNATNEESKQRTYYKKFAPYQWEQIKDLAAQLQMFLLPRLKPTETLR